MCFERAGIGFSHGAGQQTATFCKRRAPGSAGRAWEAMGVSLVFHPRNPYIPTVHMNVRFFVAKAQNNTDKDTWWFLAVAWTSRHTTVLKEDAIHFHRTNKTALDAFGATYYPKFKKECDEYFYLKHRQEPTRHRPASFLDDFNELGFERSFELLRAVGDQLFASVPANCATPQRYNIWRARA